MTPAHWHSASGNATHGGAVLEVTAGLNGLMSFPGLLDYVCDVYVGVWGEHLAQVLSAAGLNLLLGGTARYLVYLLIL